MKKSTKNGEKSNGKKSKKNGKRVMGRRAQRERKLDKQGLLSFRNLTITVYCTVLM